MPNWVTNIVTLPPQILNKYLKVLTAEDNPRRVGEKFFDFELVIPPPEDYIRGDCSHEHGAFLGGVDEAPHCWYSWNIREWGTKWNSSDNEISGVEGDLARIRFDTAWSHPYPIIETISKQHPDVPIKVQYADEDLGSNCGTYVMLDGVLVEENMPEYGPEARNFAAQIKYGKSYADLERDED